ncbi:MAG: hypothetical protein JW748_02595 [Anaerolineales bacterium]|nr:hypothetical protein [Anaerolineales bacterium]
MARIFARIFCLCVLTLAFSACGANPASPVDSPEASFPPTWTDSVPSPEPALTIQETPTPEIAAPDDSAPEATIDSSGAGNPPLEPTVDPSGAGGQTPEPAINSSPTAIRPAGTSVVLCDDSEFLEDVTIPDGTVLKPGEEFKKTWRFKNTGVCEWTTEYAIGYAYGERMHGVETKLPKKVSPGGYVDITVKFRAPLVNYWYGSWWRLKNASGANFGDFVFVSVVVAEGTPYPTMTPTL